MTPVMITISISLPYCGERVGVRLPLPPSLWWHLCPPETRLRPRSVRAGTCSPTILVIGLKPERLIDSEGRIDAFLEPPTQEQGETLVEAVRSGAEAGGHVVAIVPQWLKGDGLLRLQMVQSALDDEAHDDPRDPAAAARRGRAGLARLGGRAAPALDRRARLAAARARGRAARLHLAGQRQRPQRARADDRPAHGLAQPRQRVRRLVLSRAVRAQAGPRRRRHPAAADRAPDAPGDQRPRRQRRAGCRPSTARSAASRCARSSRRPTARRGGAPASWSRASPTRSTCSGSPPSWCRPPTRGRAAGAGS